MLVLLDILSSFSSEHNGRYSDVVVSDLYEQSFGDPFNEPDPKLNPSKVTLANFFASQILVDEGIAQQAFAAAKASSGALLVLVADVNRVKYGFGVVSRLQRAAKLTDSSGPSDEVRELCLSVNFEELQPFIEMIPSPLLF